MSIKLLLRCELTDCRRHQQLPHNLYKNCDFCRHFMPTGVGARSAGVLSSTVRTLESWIRIPLGTWMYVCDFPVSILSRVGRQTLQPGRSTVQGVLQNVHRDSEKREAFDRIGLLQHARRLTTYPSSGFCCTQEYN
jgi:hypothetical protein